MFLIKSHIKEYSKKDGTVVHSHEDIRNDSRHKRYIGTKGVEMILLDYREGMLTIPQIASKYNCSTTSVTNIVRRNEAKSRRHSEEKRQIAIFMYQDGKSGQQTADALGLPLTNILRWVREAGISRTIKLPSDIKSEMIRLYTEQMKSPSEIASIMGVSLGSVQKQIQMSGMSRTKTEASALKAGKNNAPRGVKGWWQSSKTRRWEHAASITEMLRMKQLDEDTEVVYWTKNVPIIKYGKRSYLPDFKVTLSSGDVFIEEVKWEYDHNKPINLQKWEAARAYCELIGWKFRVISEKDVGGQIAIKKFKMYGLQAHISQNTRQRANELARIRYQRDKDAGKNPSHRPNKKKISIN